MKRYTKIALSGFSVLLVLAGLRLLANQLPVKLEGPEWDSIEECAENQKNLYQSIEGEVQQNGKLPDPDFLVHGFPARDTWKCPACGRGYTLHLENYGNPRAVVIADEQDRHPTTFMWWFRGLHPQVQTMGDGTTHLFKGGKILTMVGRKKKTQEHTRDRAVVHPDRTTSLTVFVHERRAEERIVFADECDD